MVIDGVSEIGPSAYYGKYPNYVANKLKSLYIGNSVTSIGTSAFYYCISLTSLVIPDSVTEIGSSTFYDCRSLTSLVIPDSVTSIGLYAFYNCPSSCSITFDKQMSQVSAMTNYPWGIDSGAVISCSDGNLTV